MNSRTLRVLEYEKLITLLQDQCHSSIGRDLAAQTLPFQDREKIERALQETGEAETMLLQRGSFALEGLQDVLFLLKKAEVGSVLDPGQLLQIKRQISTARKCRSFFNSMEKRHNMTLISEVIAGIQSAKPLEDKIEICILSDTEVADQASHLLRQIRRQIVHKNDAVKSKLNEMIQSVKMQKFLQDALVTIRGGRYVVPVKHEYRSMVPGLVHDQSSSGATLFIEPMAVVELNNQLRELRLKEELEVERVLSELTEAVTEYVPIIRENQLRMIQLDFWMAKGRLSVQMKAVMPELSEKQELLIKCARHPLLPVNDVVPITLKLENRVRAMIITGPNTGGKTVSLKTAGLLVLMAQSGLHIPAEYGSRLGIFKQIFADIGDEQSIEQSLSTFSSHMTNIAEILRQSEDRSLILLDELGAGTDPDEGAALAMAILDHLIKKRTLVIATTHYSELKEFALMNEMAVNASVEFDVETLSPTYHLITGIPGKSNAFEISKKLGLDPTIIDDARSRLTRENVAFEDVLKMIDRNRRQTEAELENALKERLAVEKLSVEIQNKANKLEEQKERVIREARKEAQQLLKETKSEIDQLLSEIKTLQYNAQQSNINRESEKIRTRFRDQMQRVEEGEVLFEKPMVETAMGDQKLLNKGDEVRIPSLDQSGIILSIDKNQNQALVQVGMMKTSLPLGSLVRDTSKKKIHQGVQQIIRQKSEISQGELDLRGLDLEEARFLSDKFLDDAYLSGRQQIIIIHGVGTGVLKRGIHEMLKKNRHVQSFREGKYGEGGAGVTVVEISPK